MILVILYCGAGVYMLLMAAGLLHRSYVKKMPQPAKIGLVIFGAGLLVIGSYYAWYYYFRSTPEGKALIELQEEMNKRANQPQGP